MIVSFFTRHILYPIDFSPRCEAMAPFVAALAKVFQAKLTLVNVLDSGPFSDDFDAIKHQFMPIRDVIRRRLTTYQEETFAGIDIDHVFKLGDPVEEIVLLAERIGADLIAIPTQGRTRFRELLLGFVTAGVLHDTGCAVFTTAHLEAIGRSAALPQTILCAVDMSPVSTDVLAIGGHFAEHLCAALHVVHVLPGGTSSLSPEEEENLRALYARLAKAAEIEPPPLELLAGPGVADAVLETEARLGAGLLVIGRGKLQGILGRLRTGAHELIRRSRCPVLSY